MRDYCLMMNAKLKSLTTRIRRDSGSRTDVLPLMMSVALDTIGICGFGVDFGATEKVGAVKSEFQEACSALTEETLRISVLPWFIRLFDYSKWNNFDNAMRVIRTQIDAIRRAFVEMKNENQFDRRAMISELLAMEESGEFDHEQETSEMAALLLAGHETTATTISWALY
jgi:cytochrome P450